MIPLVGTKRPPAAGSAHVDVRGFFCALALAVALAGCGPDGDASTKINGSIQVPAGRPASAVATVNGSIHVADGAEVTSATTVNGEVSLGDRAKAESLNSVNGAIVVGNGAHVSGAVSSVNGEFTLMSGAEVSGPMSNVNGQISLTAAHVGGAIKTINGSVNISGASRVDGGILVQKPSGNLSLHQPRIVIGPGATVQGEMRFERPVTLFVSDKATIGMVTGATAVAFSGDSPPD
jgi:DUF4097 and DUF4098 domain-containing protein YvlB